MPDLAAEVLSLTRNRIRSYGRERKDWNVWLSLKNLTEQAVHDYEHRAVVELLQNAHDAHSPTDESGRVLVALDEDEGDHGVLYVANTGQPFTRSNFYAITNIARSDKRPEEGIGNKGIGFKSVLQLSRAPQIYSVRDARTSQHFDGYCFTFADTDTLLSVVEGDADLAADVAREIFHLCLPLPLAGVPAQAEAMLADGYVTVVRLPLKSEEARQDARQQISELAEAPPALLFLHRITMLTIDHQRDGELERQELRRVQKPVARIGSVELVSVDLGKPGEFLLASKAVAPADFTAAIERSVAGDHLSEGWRDWSGEARVEVAVPLDGYLSIGRLYAHLPMGAHAVAPLPAFVNAPFFARLARVDLEETVPLNDFLLDEIAGLCADVMLACSAGQVLLSPTTCADLLSWDKNGSDRLRRAFRRVGSAVEEARIVPVVAESGQWSSLSEVYLWNDAELRVLTMAQLSSSAHLAFVHPAIIGPRADRLDETARLLASRTLRPSDDDVAVWSEHIARTLSSDHFDAEVWASFYDELARRVRSREVLQGKRILLDDGGQLQRCNAADDAGGPVAFFAPQQVQARLTLPPRLLHRVVFLHQAIPATSRSGAITTKRLGRRMLENANLVTEYRAADLLSLLGKALHDGDDGLAAEVLSWTYDFARGQDDPPWHDIRAMGLRVPAGDGRWIPADKAFFSPAWTTPLSKSLGQLISQAAGASDELTALSRRMLVGPDEPIFRGRTEEWRTFLKQLEVRDGLWPQPMPSSTLRATGSAFEMASTSIAPPSLPHSTKQLWLAAVRQRAPRGLRPQTTYVSTTPLYRLPGQDDHDRLPDTAKQQFAVLIAHGLSHWPDEAFSTQVRRHNASSDQFSLPSPVEAFLKNTPWLPTSKPGEATARFVSAADAWSPGDEQAPKFIPLIQPRVLKPLEVGSRAIQHATAIGIQVWDDRSTAGHRVRLLAELLRDGQVPDTLVTHFRRAYEVAWDDCARTRRFPFLATATTELVVSRGGRLEVLALPPNTTGNVDGPIIYVEDTDARQTVQLLEHCAAPVLRLRGPHASDVASLLEQRFDTRVRRVSRVDVTVQVNGKDFRAGADGDPLVTNERGWLLDVLAAIIDLRGGKFRRHSTGFLRDRCALASRVRVVLASKLDYRVDRLAAGTASSGHRWLAMAHDNAPTILLECDLAEDEPQLLQRCAAGLMELLGLPELGDTLHLTLIKLAATGPWDETRPGASEIAWALNEDLHRVSEIMRTIREPMDVLLEVLIPILAALDSQAAARLLAEDGRPSSIDELGEWLQEHAAHLNSAALLAAASTGDLNAARTAMGIRLPELNAAITMLGPPYQLLRNDEGIEQEFRHYVALHRNQILDALRAGHLQAFRAQEPLTRYLKARDLTTLRPDPTWPDEHLEVDTHLMRERVNNWLSDAGAVELGQESRLRPIETVRAENRATMIEQVKRAQRLITAWESAHNVATSSLPGDPVVLADEAGANGLLDFEPVDDRTTIAWLHRTSRWPEGMTQTLSKEDLQLSSDALTKAKRAQEDARRQRAERRRQVTIDNTDYSAEEENYQQVVNAVRAGITDKFLASPGTVSLSPVDRRRTTPGRGGSGFTAAHQEILSETQAAAVGLAGEIAALEWLKAHYDGVDDGAWKSGYRNQIIGDGGGDDTLGYDFVVERASTRLYFEVKSSPRDPRKFLLTSREIARAGSLRKLERYHLLYVAHALDSDLRRIYRLPNPIDPKNAHLFSSIGEGMHFRFELSP